MAERVSAPAPAKVNLSLEVLGPRADGYHEIRTIIQTISLADLVTVTVGAGDPPILVSGPFACGTPADETNLAWRAAASLAARVGRSLDGLSIAIEKRIPAAGGLGGGASDAATTLRLLQRLWPGATGEDVLGAANTVGSDEAALALGGTVLASGRGDVAEALPALPPHGVVLFVSGPAGDGKTARMFGRLSGRPYDDGALTSAMVERHPAGVSAAAVYNSFERVARDAFPGLGALWADLERRIGAPVHLAGAGPTLFWIGDKGQAGRVAEAAAGAACQVIEAETAPSLWTR